MCRFRTPGPFIPVDVCSSRRQWLWSLNLRLSQFSEHRRTIRWVCLALYLTVLSQRSTFFWKALSTLCCWSCMCSLLCSLQANQSEKHIGQYYTLPSAHIRTLFPHGLPWRYQQQVFAPVLPEIALCFLHKWNCKSVSFLNSVLSCAVGEDVQRSMRDGEVSSSGGHLLFKENRLQQTCNAILILYPLKAQTPEHSLFLTSPEKMCFVNLDKWFRWIERHREDNVSLPRHSLLLYAGMAGAAHSRWWEKAQLCSNMFFFCFLLKCTPYLIWSVFLLLTT